MRSARSAGVSKPPPRSTRPPLLERAVVHSHRLPPRSHAPSLPEAILVQGAAGPLAPQPSPSADSFITATWQDGASAPHGYRRSVPPLAASAHSVPFGTRPPT